MAEPAPTATTEDEPGKVYEDEGGKYTVGTILGRQVKLYGLRANPIYRESLPGAKWRTWSGEVHDTQSASTANS